MIWKKIILGVRISMSQICVTFFFLPCIYNFLEGCHKFLYYFLNVAAIYRSTRKVINKIKKVIQILCVEIPISQIIVTPFST